MRTKIVVLTIAVAAAAVCLGAGAAVSSAKTVWLCFPGHHPDPCTPGLSTTVLSPNLKKIGVEHPRAVAKPPIDCFYVYPTVSDEPTGNADLRIQSTERSTALFQASRYSQYCRVYAPMYRQVTLAALGGIPKAPPVATPPNPALGFEDVQNAFETYLHRYNHGRGFVLIGHSQGSYVLRALITADIDPSPAVRKLLVSAILMGGNVVVPRGTEIGGDFKHIPGCRSARELGCVIAFSTFDQTPPSDTFFGRPLSATLTPINNPNVQVLCTNPAALAGGSGLLDPIAPSAPFAPGSIIARDNGLLHFRFPHPPTVYWTAPGAYSGRCVTENGATVLEIKPRHGAPTPTPAPTPAWGLHLLDPNIALGNLISIVKSESAAFAASGR